MLKKNRISLLVACVAIIAAFLLALIPLPKQLFFYFDQARDAFSAYAIWHNFHLPILGPMTDIPGLFHGVLWYYFLTIPYFLGNNNFYFTGYFLLILLFLTLPVCGYLVHKLFNNLFITITTMILYAFSPLFQISTRWVSNPVIALLITPFLLLFLWKYISKQNIKEAILAGLAYGLLIQSNFAFVIFLILLPIYFLIFKLKFKITEITFFAFGLLLALSTYIIAEIKFHGRGIIALIHYISSSHSSKASFINIPITTVNKYLEFLSVSILPLSTFFIILIILIIILIFLRKSLFNSLKENEKPILFLVIWQLNIILFELFNTGISRSLFVFLPSLLPLIILGSYLLCIAIKNKIALSLTIIILVCLQLSVNLSWIERTLNPLTVQKGMTYANEQKIVDYTYEASKKENFIINTITSPLYINTTWAYLYEFYGKNKYKYLPYWDGRDQNGYLGNLSIAKTPTKIRYLIIEPTTGIPDFFVKEAISAENTKSTLMNTQKVGNFVVEKRSLK
jgi:hypothetical protein